MHYGMLPAGFLHVSCHSSRQSNSVSALKKILLLPPPPPFLVLFYLPVPAFCEVRPVSMFELFGLACLLFGPSQPGLFKQLDI